ncbi:hypothetical protein EDB83DRAFT_2513796 [Lactarius deliciosus]|nr:hypothetical protein EDB83DRAFT_2513796 [Lactarius deliciosus]
MHGVRHWSVHIAQTWDVLGPFPIHAREQHFLSPSFPLELTKPIDLDASYPSSLADGGRVHWSKASSDPDSNLTVSFPHIRWASLRATEGWAALQHHVVLRTTLTVLPPRSDSDSQTPPTIPNFLLQIKKGSFFTLVPTDVEDHVFIPEWYSGNIYEVDHAPSHLVRFPTVPSPVSPTVYYLYISGDYEIRLFGDPRDTGSEVPALNISVNVCLDSPTVAMRREASRDVVPDFVDGFAFGDALGIGLRCLSTSSWTVTALSPSPESRQAGITLSLLRETLFVMGQTRVLPVRIAQSRVFSGDTLSFDVHATSGESSLVLPVQVYICQLDSYSMADTTAIKAAYFSPDTAPLGFITLPPKNLNALHQVPGPPIMALHGAGVNIFKQPFWVDAIPRQEWSWVILPEGRSPWGLDWHGPSADDAWGTVSALDVILKTCSRRNAWAIAPEKVVNHWPLKRRTRHRITVIPAAGYIKAQAYVPLTQSRSAHFIDPFLRAILECSFTPDDNDLFLSNLVDTPTLAIHGGADKNVPTWHSREAVSILKTWATDAIVDYREDQGNGHWYPSVFRNAQVKAFLDSVLAEKRDPPRRSTTFTLTAAVPADTGSLHGWRILNLLSPGRLARLTVETVDGVVVVRTSNVRRFSIDVGSARRPTTGYQRMHYNRPRRAWLTALIPEWLWQIIATGESPAWEAQRSTSPYTILRSSGPLKIVVSGGGNSGHEMSVARRLVHDLGVYYKLDADIVLETDVMVPSPSPGRRTLGESGSGNIVVIGSPSGRYIRQCLEKGKTAFSIADRQKGPSVLQLRGETLNDPSQGIMFTHPHESSPSSTMLFIIAHDRSGLERAARLFPTRTGLALADWMVIGKRADEVGASGIQKAGYEEVSNLRKNSALNVSRFTDFGDPLGNITVECRGSINGTYEERYCAI